MDTIRFSGKDKVIFLTKEDWDKPPVNLPESFIESLEEEEGPKGKLQYYLLPYRVVVKNGILTILWDGFMFLQIFFLKV